MSLDNFLIAGMRPYSLHWFAQHNGAKQFLLWTDQHGGISYLNPSRYEYISSDPWNVVRDFSDNRWSSTGEITRTFVDGPWQGEQSVCWGGNLYLCNGYDPVICFDGYKTSEAGYSVPPSPPHATAADPRMTNPDCDTINKGSHDFGVGEIGLGLLDENDPASDETFFVGTFSYRVSFVNERGQESPISAVSDMVLVRTRHFASSDVVRGFVHLQLPIGPPGTVARRLYRTKNNIALTFEGDNEFNIDPSQAVFFFHSEIQDNMSTTFDDCSPDFMLGSQLSTSDYGAIPSGVKYMASFKNTMFYAGMTANQLRFSRPLFPEITPLANTIEIGASSHGPITGMYATKNALVVFKTRAIYLIKGDTSSGFYAQTLTEDSGCVAPGSIREIPGVGLVYLGLDGVNVLDGALENTGTQTRVSNISAPIQKYIDDINFSAALNVRSIVHHKDKEFWLCIPRIGQQENDMILVFHYDIGAWSIRPDFPVKCVVETADHRGYVYFGLTSVYTEAGLKVYSRGYATKGSENTVDPKWESIWIKPISEYNVFQPIYADVYAIAYGDNQMLCDHRLNRSVMDARDAPTNRDMQDPGEQLDIYGEAEWGADSTYWGYFRPVPIRFGLDTKKKPRTREMQVSFAAEGTRMQIIGFAIEIQVGEASNQTPIDTAIVGNR